MTDIKIFVSHRIDIDSELVDNPLYVPVRCGAVFDTENSMCIIGDDTGNHISQRRMSFCEFTVQYWAWKNVTADYYGLCHYRRYLSFSEQQFKTDEYSMIYVPSLTPKGKQKYGLLDATSMARLIGRYDIIVAESAPVKNIPTPTTQQHTVRGLWDAYDGEFLKKSTIISMFQLIDQLAPEYSRSAKEYFNGDQHRGFNCYILKNELFNRLCKFQFPIMFEIDHLLDTHGYSQTMLRTPAFIGEMLYGIFIYHITTYEQWRVKELQLVFFKNTEHILGKADLCKRYISFGIDRGLRAIVDPIMPKGTRRRKIAKAVFYKLRFTKCRGVAEIKHPPNIL